MDVETERHRHGEKDLDRQTERNIDRETQTEKRETKRLANKMKLIEKAREW